MGNPKDRAAQAEDRAPLDLSEGVAEEAIARVLALGAKKYGRQNYRVEPVNARVYAAAMRRHIRAWMEGEDIDPESGQHHLAHVGANVHIVLAAEEQGTLIDDRGPGELTKAADDRETFIRSIGGRSILARRGDRRIVRAGEWYIHETMDPGKVGRSALGLDVQRVILEDVEEL